MCTYPLRIPFQNFSQISVRVVLLLQTMFMLSNTQWLIWIWPRRFPQCAQKKVSEHPTKNETGQFATLIDLQIYVSSNPDVHLPLRIPFQNFSQISCHFTSINNVYVVKHTVVNLDLTPPFPSHTHYESFNEVIQTLETMAEILKCDHSKESGTFMWFHLLCCKKLF